MGGRLADFLPAKGVPAEKKEIPDIHIRCPGLFVFLSIEIISTNKSWKS